ncbi:helix-turn-helix domain-containing protein [uncultured Cellulomonas sp.]|uniref:TetR/AcrR family transcriptional regulator n=1 Tax=uncultured Cellulomonas sp. TaxID=189682 RepID=UPI0028E75253|nr:helix-turn-helix domain-containing protein [uncultured Cellulomonas sp.]
MSSDQITTLTAKKRMSGVQRREEILVAARTVFAERGYAASTDEVARAAGVSQPYVVRLFGTKRELFLEAYKVASAQIVTALTAVPAGPDAAMRMGDAYIGLLADRDLLRMVMHGFIAGADEEVGRVARHTLGEAFRLFQERSGEDEQAARVFVAQGMLINVLLAVDAPAHVGEDAGMDALLQCVQDDIAERATA